MKSIKTEILSRKQTKLWLSICVSSVAQSCLPLCDPMDFSPPASSVLGILWARILEWVAMPSSRGSSPPRDHTCVSCVSWIGRWILHHCTTWEGPPFTTTSQFSLWPKQIYKVTLQGIYYISPVWDCKLFVGLQNLWLFCISHVSKSVFAFIYSDQQFKE